MLWALTGCSGTGASTVAGVWRELGASVCSLDMTGHRFLGKPGVKEVLQRSTGLPVDPGMPVDTIRAELREKAFTDPGTLKAVNSVLHPRMRRWAGYSSAFLRNTPGVFVLDAALVFELELDRYPHYIVTVRDTMERAVERLTLRDSISRESAEGRWQNQMDIGSKCLRSHFVISNSGSKDELIKNSIDFYNNIITRMEDAAWHTRPGKN